MAVAPGAAEEGAAAPVFPAPPGDMVLAACMAGAPVGDTAMCGEALAGLATGVDGAPIDGGLLGLVGDSYIGDPSGVLTSAAGLACTIIIASLSRFSRGATRNSNRNTQ